MTDYKKYTTQITIKVRHTSAKAYQKTADAAGMTRHKWMTTVLDAAASVEKKPVDKIRGNYKVNDDHKTN